MIALSPDFVASGSGHLGGRVAMVRVGALAIGMVGVCLAGCSVSTSSFHTESAAGGTVVGTLGTPPEVPAGPPSMGAFLEGPAGQQLGDADKERAYQAALDALQSGQRKTWRGVKGNFGYVVPATPAGPDGCRTFSQTVFIGGRARVGSGSGCPAPDGTWKITG